MTETSVVALGSEGSGKTALILRYVQSLFNDFYDPHIVEEYKTQDTVDGETIVMKISDVCGCADYIGIRDAECEKADGYMFVIDACSTESLSLVQSIRETVVERIGDKPSVLVATKCDCEDLDVLEEARKLGSAWQVPLIECSSKLPFGVSEAFHHIARLTNPSLSQGLRKNWDESIVITEKSSKIDTEHEVPLCGTAEISLLLSTPSPSPPPPAVGDFESVHITAVQSDTASSTSCNSKKLDQYSTSSLIVPPKASTAPDFTGLIQTPVVKYTESPDEGSLRQPLLGDQQVNFAKPSHDNLAWPTATPNTSVRMKHKTKHMAPMALGPAASLPPQSEKLLTQFDDPRTPMHVAPVESFSVEAQDGKKKRQAARKRHITDTTEESEKESRRGWGRFFCC